MGDTAPTPNPPRPPILPRIPIPATPAEEGEATLRSAGQRRVNIIWEMTQALIACGVVTTVLVVSAWQTITGPEPLKVAAFGFLIGVANLVIGFYFGRTNHQRIGGVGGGFSEGGR